MTRQFRCARTSRSYCNRAILFAELNRPDEALQGYELALQFDPSLPSGYVGRGRSSKGAEKWMLRSLASGGCLRSGGGSIFPRRRTRLH
jgi:Tetratricopeptide repeat